MQLGKLCRFYIRCLIMNGRSENYNYTKFSENYQTMLSQLELLLVMFNKRVGVFYHNIKHDA